MTASLLTLPSTSQGLIDYLEAVKRFPSLEAEDEYMLAKRFHEHGDRQAAHELITSHLKLVVKIAFSFRGYGLPLMDIISEGNLGLMHAVKKFNPEMGNRLSTYAMWWIKATIQEHVIRSWSLVKMGTTAAQKKLFFNLRKIRNQIEKVEARAITAEDYAQIAKDLNVSDAEVTSMSQRFSSPDISLNLTTSDEDDTELINLVPATQPSPEAMVSQFQETNYRKALFQQALTTLNDRERDIISARRLQEPPLTLDVLKDKYRVSRERIRQIEEAAMAKLKNYVIAQMSLPPSAVKLLPCAVDHE